MFIWSSRRVARDRFIGHVGLGGSDRRERRWALTSAGETTFRKLRPKWEAAQAAFEKRLGRTEAEALKKASFLAASKLAAG
jgi:DNA-binding MarR family transcriptional regulator